MRWTLNLHLLNHLCLMVEHILQAPAFDFHASKGIHHHHAHRALHAMDNACGSIACFGELAVVCRYINAGRPSPALPSALKSAAAASHSM